MEHLETKICSIPYYRRDQYEILREQSVDKENFAISYDEMTAITELRRLDMENRGFTVIKINVDMVELIEWAASQHSNLDPESRTRFAMKKLKEIISSPYYGA